MTVYFIQQAGVPDGPIKIGYAQDPKKRLREIQCMSPVRVTILGTTPGSRPHEKSLHHKFAVLKLHCEWFRADDRLLSFIATLPIEEPKIVDNIPLF